MRASERTGPRAPRPQWRSRGRARAGAAEREPPGTTSLEAHRVPWRLSDAAVVLAVITLSAVLTRAAMNVRAVAGLEPAARVVIRAALLAGLFVVQLATLAVLCRVHRCRLRDAIVGARSQHRGERIAGDVALVLVLLLLTRVASYGWGAAARAFGWEPPRAGALSAAFGAGAVGLVVAVVALTVLGPVVEELAFRGVVLEALRRQLGDRSAVVVSALLFALCHATAWTFVPLVVLGVSLGWLVLQRGSLAPAIMLHGLYNGVVIAAAYWIGG